MTKNRTQCAGQKLARIDKKYSENFKRGKEKPWTT